MSKLSHNFKDLLLGTPVADQVEILYGACWCSGIEILFTISGHMAELAAMSIYGKNPLKFSSQNR